MDKKKRMEIDAELRDVFKRLYSYLMSDRYTSSFIPSFRAVDNLVNKQIEISLQITRLLDEGRWEDAYKESERIAKLHSNMKIHESSMFRAVDFLRKLIISSEKLSDRLVYLAMSFLDMFEKAIGITYALDLIDDTLVMIEADNPYQKSHTEWLVKLREFVIGKADELPQLDHTMCMVGKYMATLEYTIKTYTKPDLHLKLATEHKNLHNYASIFISYFSKGKYREALTILRDMLKSSILVASLLDDIEDFWRRNKEDVFSEFIRKNYESSVGIVVESEFVESTGSNAIKDLFDILKTELSPFEDMFIFLSDDGKRIYIYVYGDTTGSHNLYNTLSILKEKIESAARRIGKRYANLTRGAVYVAGIIRSRKLFRYDRETIKEVFTVIVDELRRIKDGSKQVILFVDFSDSVDRLLERANQRLRIKRLVKEKVLNGDITLFKHGIYDIASKEEIGFELLSRIKSPDGEWLPAYRFLDIIEAEAIERNFDFAVLQKALSMVENMPSGKRIFINMYPSSLQSKEIVELINKLGRRLKDKGSNLIVELTEHSLLADPKAIEYMNKKVISLALDDFGTGYTNFELVGTLVTKGLVAYLKLDGSIVKKMLGSKVYYGMVKSISDFAKSMDMNIVYEFTESETLYKELLKIAKETEVKGYCQGWFFSKPEELK